MKFFTGKKNVQKIVLVFVILILFNFIVPNYTQASTGADIGGILLSPIVSLVTAIFDGLNGMMQYMMLRRKCDGSISCNKGWKKRGV